MTNSHQVIWSIESSRKVESIKKYLSENWTQTEVRKFLNRVYQFEKFVARFPELYPASVQYPELRKAPISKYQSVIYEIEDDVIKVHTILDHRQNTSLK